MQNSAAIGFPKPWMVTGYVLSAIGAIFAGRVIYEETILTWKDGPQMIGFAVAHTMPLLLLAGPIGVCSGLLWVIVSLILMSRRRFHAPLADWAPLVFLLFLGAMLLIPYETWEELMVRTFGRSPHGGEFLVQAAAEDKQTFVSLLLRQGFDVNYQSRNGSTPLSAASVEGRRRMVSFLISKGANVNRKDGSVGESALMAAAEMGHMEVVNVLLNNGAKPCALDKEGHTAEGLARQYRHGDIADNLSSRFHCKEEIRILSCVDSDVSACVH